MIGNLFRGESHCYKLIALSLLSQKLWSLVRAELKDKQVDFQKNVNEASQSLSSSLTHVYEKLDKKIASRHFTYFNN